MSDNKGKNEKGQYVKGNTYANGVNKVQPGEERIPHPIYSWLDTKGRILPGKVVPNYKGLRGLPPHILYQELHARLLDNVADTDVAQVYKALFTLTQNGDSKEIQLKAIKLYLDRFFGQAAAAVQISTNTTETKTQVNIDLTALTNDELQDYLRLQGKVQSSLEQFPEVIIEEVRENETMPVLQDSNDQPAEEGRLS